MAQSVSLEIVLPPSHQEQLTALMDSLYDVGSPRYHRWISSAEFATQFDPSQSTVAGVESWLAGVGLRSTYRSGFSVHVSEPASAVESALGISLDDYRLRGGEVVHVSNRAPLVPPSVSNDVVSVLGLDDAPRLLSKLAPVQGVVQTMALPKTGGDNSCLALSAGVEGADQVGDAYGIGGLVSGGQTGAGQEVAVYELAPHVASDVATYEDCLGLTDTVTTVPVDGGGGPGGSGIDEADSDIEQIATQSPGVSIVSYEGPDTFLGAYDTWNAIVQQDTASVISTSYGLCEPDSLSGGLVNADEPLFIQAAVQGQTILAASGDSGSEDCYLPSTGTDTSLQVDYPASSPNVTAVGGTTLASDGSETAWNDCEGQTGTICASLGGGAGGGGVSRNFMRPAWQPAEWEWTGTENACGTDCRDVPDISANSGTAEAFFVSGSWNAYVGTSLAAPLVAGLVANTESGCVVARRGIIAQALYGLAAQGGYGTALSDVTTGDNDFVGTYDPVQYPAAVGYDPATGLGTPIAEGWSCPQVSSVSPPQARAGDQVTIDGFNLQSASFLFGDSDAQVLSATASSATVVVPLGSGSMSVRATNVMGTGASTAGFSFVPAAIAPSVVTPVGPSPSVNSGYDLVGRDGGVFTFPTRQGGYFGSLPGLGVRVNDITGMVPSPDGHGYFLVGKDGGVFAFGNTPFLGSLPGLHVAVSDIRGIVPTSDDRGYFLVGQDGGVFAFGDARFLGSLPGEGVHISDVVGIAATPSDDGYWVVAASGTVYNFGKAASLGSVTTVGSAVTGITSTGDGDGYWVVRGNGSVRSFGDAGSFGSLPALGVTPAHPVIGLVPTADAQGYWLVGSDGGIFTFGDAPFVGSLPALGVNVTDVVGAVPTSS